MTTPPRPWQRGATLAEAASAEVASRDKHYPGMVDRGEISIADAREDLAAWRAIAELFDQGRLDAGLTWSDLIAATRRAIITRDAACEARPTDGYLATRRAHVQLLHDQLDRSRAAMLDRCFPIPFAAEVPRRSQHGSSGTERTLI